MTSEPQTDLAHGGGDAPSDMGALLEESANYTTASRGAIVEGIVMGWDREGVLVDIGSKSEGVIPATRCTRMGAEPERVCSRRQGPRLHHAARDEEGQVLLSIDRARGERGWRVLQDALRRSRERSRREVTGFNKGGLLVNVEGVNAFVPLSQVVGVRPEQEGEGGPRCRAVGKQLRLKVIEINRRRNRVILSERAALQEWRSQQKDRLLAELKEGEIRKGRVSQRAEVSACSSISAARTVSRTSAKCRGTANKSPERDVQGRRRGRRLRHEGRPRERRRSR